MRGKIILFLVIAFVLGWSANSLIEISPSTEMPTTGMMDYLGITNLSSPYDRIAQNKIHVYPSHVRLDLQHVVWSNFTDTKSMVPVLDSQSHALQINPRIKEEIHVGDIISFNANFSDKRIIHRVIDIGSDEKGWYAITKGDNNQNIDPGKRRFKEIERVLIAVIY